MTRVMRLNGTNWVGEGGLEPPRPFGHRNLNPPNGGPLSVAECRPVPLSWDSMTWPCRFVTSDIGRLQPVGLHLGCTTHPVDPLVEGRVDCARVELDHGRAGAEGQTAGAQGLKTV